MQCSERSDNSIYSRIVNATNNKKVIDGESCVDDYISEYTSASMNNRFALTHCTYWVCRGGVNVCIYTCMYMCVCLYSSGSSRMDAMLQMRRELRCARLVAEGRADELRLRMDTLRSHVTSLRNEIDPPAPEETAASRKTSLPRLRQKPGNKKTASPSKLGT